MSQPRQFEGPDVRALLDEIRGIYGSDPVISRAETFRTGGLLGFFQREKFRLVVEADPAGPGSGAAAASFSPSSAAVINGASAAPTSAVAAYAAVAGRSAAATAAPAAAGPVATNSLATAGSFRYEADDDTLAADLFALLADQTEDSFEAGAPAIVAPVQEEDEDGRDLSSFEAVLRRVSSMVDSPAPVPTSPAAEPFPPVVPVGEPAPGAVPVSWPTAERTEEPPAPKPATQSAASARPADQDRPDPVAEQQAALRQALYGAGFGPGLAAAIEKAADQRGLNSAIIEVFEDLPEPPRMPRRKGSLVVVVGPGPRAATEASRIASDIGADPGRVAFASQRPSRWPVTEDLRIRTAEDAMEMAPGHRRGRIGVVAVDLPVGSASSAWARHVIHALRPTLVVGVVDAMYKTEDIDAWVRDLDGVDTLIVDNVETTTSPARILELELPVTRLGEHAAGPIRWAAAVLDRIPTEMTREG